MGSDAKRRCDPSSDPDGHLSDIDTSTPDGCIHNHTPASLYDRRTTIPSGRDLIARRRAAREVDDVVLAPPISLRAMTRYHRAAEGMTGGIKASGNYAPCFKASQEVKAAGFNEVGI